MGLISLIAVNFHFLKSFNFSSWNFLQMRRNFHDFRTFVIRRISIWYTEVTLRGSHRCSLVFLPQLTYTRMHIFRNSCVKRGNAFRRSQMVTSNTFYVYAAIKQLIHWRYEQIELGYCCNITYMVWRILEIQ